MKKLISFLTFLFVFGSLWQANLFAQCLPETYLHKLPHKTGEIAMEKLDFVNIFSGQTEHLTATISHKIVGGKSVAFLNEYFADDGALRNSVRIKADGNLNYYGVDLLGKGVTTFWGGATNYYVLANTSAGNNPSNFGGVALFKLNISPSGNPTLLWEVQLGHTTMGDYNNTRDNKAVSLERLEDGSVLVIGNKIENGNGCVKPFVTRVDPAGNVIFQKFYGDCNLSANGSTLTELIPEAANPNARLAITGEKKDITGASDIFVMLIDISTGNLSWVKSYFSSTQPDVEIGRSITSYRFVSGQSSINRLVVTGEVRIPNTPYLEQDLFVLEAETTTGALQRFRIFEVVDGPTKLHAQGLVVRKGVGDKYVVGGRLFYPGNNGNQHPFLLNLIRGGSIDWFKMYLNRDVITPYMDLVHSKQNSPLCDFYNVVAIGESNTPWILDYHTLQFRTTANGNIDGADCLPQDKGVIPIDVGGELELQKVVLDFPDWEGYPTSVHKDNMNLLDCGEILGFGGFGFKEGDTKDTSIDRDLSWNLTINPNPAVDAIEIHFDLNDAAQGSVEIYNLQGQLIDQISSLDFIEGENTIPFNIAHLPNGVFLCKVLTSEKAKTVRFVKHF